MKSFITIILLLALWGDSDALSQELQQQQQRIVISEANAPFAFGHAARLKARYQNDKMTPWVIQSPRESTSVWILYRPITLNQRPWGYSFGQMKAKHFGSNAEKFTVIRPKPKALSIAANTSYSFELDFPRAWNGNIVPGLWIIWIHDKNLELESNRLEVPIYFTVESVTACLEIVADSNQTWYKRQWHSKWLIQVDPQLQLVWPKHDATEEDKARCEVEIQKNLQEFADYWKTAKDTRRVARIIAEINREAGLKVEAGSESGAEAESESSE